MGALLHAGGTPRRRDLARGPRGGGTFVDHGVTGPEAHRRQARAGIAGLMAAAGPVAGGASCSGFARLGMQEEP